MTRPANTRSFSFSCLQFGQLGGCQIFIILSKLANIQKRWLMASAYSHETQKVFMPLQKTYRQTLSKTSYFHTFKKYVFTAFPQTKKKVRNYFSSRFFKVSTHKRFLTALKRRLSGNSAPTLLCFNSKRAIHLR